MSYEKPLGYCVLCEVHHPGVTCEEYRLRTINERNIKAEAEIKDVSAKVVSETVPVPPALQNLSVTVGPDGVWLTFNVKSGKFGKTATINIGNLVNSSTFSGPITQVINEWAEDRKEWASAKT